MNILTINSGSSSIKASLFKADGTRRNFRYEQIGHARFRDHQQAFEALLADLGDDRPQAAGHRFVHGGAITDFARRVDPAERQRLQDITHLAPLHMPGNLLGVDMCRRFFPEIPQVVCFDTAFHATLPELAWRLPIPQDLGYRRYGFHGINYAHVARQLPGLIGDLANGNLVVAHLGNGASLCLMQSLQSVDTSMGYTPAAGIPMGTRSGDLDPGIMLELAKTHDAAALSRLVNHQMGLLALSGGISNEMSDLLASDQPAARFAVEYFSRQVRATIGAYAAKAGGIDALIFTGGIGEHAAEVRRLICDPLEFLGFQLDPAANAEHAVSLGIPDTNPILLIAADEEAEISRLTAELLK